MVGGPTRAQAEEVKARPLPSSGCWASLTDAFGK